MFMRENTHTDDRTDDPVHIRSSRPKWESNPNLKGKLDLRKVQIESFGKCRNNLKYSVKMRWKPNSKQQIILIFAIFKHVPWLSSNRVVLV